MTKSYKLFYFSLFVSIFILLLLSAFLMFLPSKQKIVFDGQSYFRENKNNLSSQINLTVEEIPSLDLGFEETIKSVSSLDGLKLARVLKENDKEAILLNNDLSPFYDKITFMSFSPNSQHFAYAVKNNNKEFVVINGKEGKHYDWIFSPFTFTADSNYFIYKSKNSLGYFLIINEEETKSYDYIYEPFVNQDGDTLIFYARRGSKLFKSSLKLWQ